jgi:hypothetical protein
MDAMSGDEAELAAPMRADREVDNERKADQAAVDLEATKEPPEQQSRRTRKVTQCPVCDVGPDRHCEMCGSFESCPRILPRKATP